MAYWLSLLCLSIWTTPLALATQTTANISEEILNFVPACAQSCFQSFISSNFDSRVCGNSPTLPCLCRQRGMSGYTIGEGAVSCIAGETRFGSCQGDDTDSNPSATAYNMCTGVSEAASKTHSIIRATFIVSPSGTGPLLVPTPTQTATMTGTETSLRPVPTTTTVSPDESSTSAAASPTGGQSLPSADNARSVYPNAQPPLTGQQIAGITLGVVAVVVLGILLVIIARCIRQRRFGDLEAGFSKIRESMSVRRKSRRSSLPCMEITGPLARVPTARNPADRGWHANQQTMPQGTVGLAISSFAPEADPRNRPIPPLPPLPVQQSVPKVVVSPPSQNAVPKANRSPPKPTLTLAIPKAQDRVIRGPANGRDSVVTEFAEDGEGEIAPAGAAIWRPPATDPQSATRYYFADRGGNWILRNTSAQAPETETPQRAPAVARPAIYEAPSAPVEVELPSPEHKTRAERAKDSFGGFSPDAVVSPLRIPSKQGRTKLGSPIAFRDQSREPRYSSTSSDLRSPQASQTVSGVPMAAKSRPPDTYFAMIREARDLTGGKSRRRSSRRASRRVSQDSATSIESAVAEPFEEEDIIEDEPQVDLSPVAESPHTPISPGKSPVTYPRMPQRTGSQQPVRTGMTPEVDFLPAAHRYNMWHPPQAKPQNAGGSLRQEVNITPPTYPAKSSGPARPWNTPYLNPVPSRNPGQPRTGSPDSRLLPMPSVEQQYRQRQQQVANPASYWSQPQTRVAPVRPSRAPRRYELPGETTLPWRNDLPSQRQRTPQPAEQQQEQPSPPTPQSTGSSSQSSLLAKRRGVDKAATLALSSGNGDGKADNSMMRRGKAGWTKEEPSGPVPITPGWVPELTPTRQGDDLYLNVR